ncbi:ABC transporter substrate-binding protein [Acetobacterium woodii]|uniref:Extracellular ligand-binding receptor n=1 Tax=Acetobacterium woodii (strain ATCC 29683 / DSM 1030 / JCM 2381 / KCTC 1655 / WB1) TaxID=931626 RepID=H6LGK7_ACEWD|nr:ABC transporter substrate-binding protein [Acetobacterium woodii]AFA48335.1 extracellular ligand-binding receptor [Acetobacterium woodii DSM 1030]
MDVKKIIFFAILVVSAIIVITACFPKKTVTIGFSAGLTGSTSDMGVNGRNGLMMAVNEVNAAGGVNNRQVEVIIKDDQNNPETALAVDQELYEEGVSFIIGHMTSNMAELSLPFVNDNDLLMISPTMSSYELVNQDDHFISVVSSNDVEAAFIAKIILEKGGKNVAVIYESQNGSYTNTIKSFIGSDLAEKGGQIIYQEAFQGGNNPPYLEIANRVSSMQPDSIVILASSFDAAMFCQQFYKSGSQVPLYLSLWAMNNDLILQGGDAVEGVQIPSLIDTQSQKPEYVNFKESYLKQYGSAPTFAAIYAYEAAKILFETMETKNSFDPEIIKEAIIKKSTYRGLQDEITIDENGDAKRSLYHYLIKDGQFEKVD